MAARHVVTWLSAGGTYAPTCTCGWTGEWSVGPSGVPACPRYRPAQVITHPSALRATLEASVEAAERGELPSQQRAKAEREAKVEALRERATDIALRAARQTFEGVTVRLMPDYGWGRDLANIHEQLKALGAEEE
jgi:hypothetical protein